MTFCVLYRRFWFRSEKVKCYKHITLAHAMRIAGSFRVADCWWES